MPVYLDNNASTHLDPRVLEAMLPYLSGPHANPSSVHRYGRMARDAVESARHQVARLVNAQPQDLVWTSGGTESNNLAVKGIVGRGAILYGATEHPAVMEAAESIGATPIAVDGQGLVQWPLFESQLQSTPARLVCLMRANNETGVVQDVARAARLAARRQRLAACRRGASRRQDWRGFRHARLRPDEPVQPQDLRSQRHWRLVREKRNRVVPTAPRRTAGARLARRHRERRGIVGFGVAAELALGGVGAARDATARLCATGLSRA